MGSIAVFHARTAPPDATVAERMLRAAPHRGTELELRRNGTTILGISNDPGLRDAWLASDNGTSVAFAGTLDNDAELLAELARAGHETPASDPARTVLAAWRAWGEETPSRLRGMLNGAISDGTSVWCFRDHLGFRPFFYRDDSRGFFAATEAKQVIAGAGIGREPDLEGLQALLFGGRTPTSLRGVERFPSSSQVLVNGNGGPRFTRYWDPSPLVESARLSIEEACDGLVHYFDQAVRRSVTGNDAVSLSGGIDSPTVAAFAAAAHLDAGGRPLRAVSAVYPDHPSVDERRYVELISDYLGLELHTYVPEGTSLDNVEFWVDLLDGPVETISMPALEENYRMVRTVGARTVMSGELAEYVYAFGYHLVGHLLLHGRFREAGKRIRAERERGVPWTRILRPLALSMAPPSVATRYSRWRRHDPRNLPPWVDPTKARVGHRPDLTFPARKRFTEIQIGPTGRGGVSPTLEADEICAAYAGVHVRRPLADVDLWEFCLSLRAETKYPVGLWKALVRRAMAGRLPDEILSRQDKTMFDAHSRATANYPALRKWLLGGKHRIDGVNYTMLQARIESGNMSVVELKYAKDLARIHAFLSRFE